jgi:hypothetical protein
VGLRAGGGLRAGEASRRRGRRCDGLAAGENLCAGCHLFASREEQRRAMLLQEKKAPWQDKEAGGKTDIPFGCPIKSIKLMLTVSSSIRMQFYGVFQQRCNFLMASSKIHLLTVFLGKFCLSLSSPRHSASTSPPFDA